MKPRVSLSEFALEPSAVHKNAARLRVLRNSFLRLLNRRSTSEQVLQDYLEEHSELIPVPWMLNHGLHFDAMISKFPLDTSLKSDLAYLTKSTAEWYLTLVELEHPSKRIFTENKRVATLSADFNAALNQITGWRIFTERHGDEVKRRLHRLMPFKLAKNRVRFKFVLIYGRNAEFQSDHRVERFAHVNGQDLTVLTYDSLIRGLQLRGGDRKNILTLSRDTFKLKYLNCDPGSLFAYLTPHDIEISQEQKAKLMSAGFQMDRWSKGKLLRISHRYTDIDSLMDSEAFKRAHPQIRKRPKRGA